MVHESATVLDAPIVSNGKHTHIHPLDQLYPEEIREAAAAFRKEHPNDELRFKFITAREPRKAELIRFLDDERRGLRPRPPTRVAATLYSSGAGSQMEWYEAWYSLSDKRIIEKKLVPAEHKAQGDPDEVVELEQILLDDPEFQRRIKEYKLPPGATVAADPWIYGSDSTRPIPRLVTYMVYYRLPNADPDTNHYSFPLPICPVIDSAHKKIIDYIYCPTGGKGDGVDADTLDRNDPVGHLQPSEYMEHLVDYPMRNDLKPIRIDQPEGASFRIEGQRISWQKWSFILSFNYREGIVLHDVHYDGRSVFYRLSLSEMTVPYGDPRAPYHRKQAFDSGDAGLGLCANQLDLGCDCLGLIKYFNAVVSTPAGEAKEMKNVVCMHEVDDGLLWKHTNYRTDNACVVRSRHLVLQTICTVSNYEYIWIWKFDQAGAVHFETRATGCLSTCYIDKGKVSPYGNVVAPGVMAPNHQHVFCLRIDPAIDGHKNTVVYEDSKPIPWGPANPHGVAWTVDQTVIKNEGFADASPLTNRVFKMINRSKLNPISGRPVGYKFTPHPGALMLAHQDSIAFKRAEFGGHHVYVTKYRDDELYSGGNYTYQSSGNAKGMLTMISREDDVEDDDFVLWNSFCLTHNVRIEDWPVMPYESLSVSLKPADFFTSNPSMDVPRSKQGFNKSTAYDGLTESNDKSCCDPSARL